MRMGRPVWLSPDAPADQRPTPLAQRPLSALGVTSAVAGKLAAEGIKTVADLRAYEDAGRDITKIKGVGPGTAEKIRRAVLAWENA